MALASALFTGRDAGLVSWFGGIGEASNPFLTVSEIMTFNSVKSQSVSTLQILFMIVFTVLRLVGFVVIRRMNQGPTILFFKLGATIVWVMSMDWMLMMFNKASKLALGVS